VASIDEAMDIAARDGDELCVIGGGEVYALALAQATRMYLTRVDTVVEDADAFFPAFDVGQWRVTAIAAHPADAVHAFAFDFVDYARID
jgi:dihydrofolate reductase